MESSLWYVLMLNLVLPAGLAYICGRSYASLQSETSLGLVLLAVFFQGKNALAAYVFPVDPTLTSWITTP